MSEPFPVIHPGLVLADVVVPALKKAGVTKIQLAYHLGMCRQNLENVLAAKQPITPAVALRLGKLVGEPQKWMWLQARYDLAVALEKMGPELEALPDLSAIELQAA